MARLPFSVFRRKDRRFFYVQFKDANGSIVFWTKSIPSKLIESRIFSEGLRDALIKTGMGKESASMYSFGMSDRNIQKHLEQAYNVEVSPDLISRVTNEVIEEV